MIIDNKLFENANTLKQVEETIDKLKTNYSCLTCIKNDVCGIKEDFIKQYEELLLIILHHKYYNLYSHTLAPTLKNRVCAAFICDKYKKEDDK